jgi:hypothetical protein
MTAIQRYYRLNYDYCSLEKYFDSLTVSKIQFLYQIILLKGLFCNRINPYLIYHQFASVVEI